MHILENGDSLPLCECVSSEASKMYFFSIKIY